MTVKLVNLADPSTFKSKYKAPDPPPEHWKYQENLVKQKTLEEDGFISAASNKSGTTEKYEGHLNYKQIYNAHRKNTKDMWYHVPFYGKTNKKGFAAGIYHTDEHILNVAGVQMMDFVAKAFLDFAEAFNKLANLPCCKGINKNSGFLKQVSVKRSYRNEEEERDTYLEELYDDFYADVLSNLKNSPKLTNFDDFYKYLKTYLMSVKKPFTTSGFSESVNKTDYHTGLIVDILALQEDLDVSKIKFLEDPNYKTYSIMAQRYGFKVDINVPWRMIADVNSKKMAKYIAETRGEGVDYYEVLTKRNATYLNVAARYNGFLLTLINFYEKFREKHPRFFTAPPSKAFSMTSVGSSSGLATDFFNTKAEALKRAKEVGCGGFHSMPDGSFMPCGSHQELVKTLLNKFSVTRPVNYFQYKTIKQSAASTAGETVDLNVRVLPPEIIGWYAEIRNIERGSPYNKVQMKRIITTARRIYTKAIDSLATPGESPFDRAGPGAYASDPKFYKFANLAITYIEGIFGTIGAHSPSKFLTVTEGDPIMIMHVADNNEAPQPIEEIRQSPYEWLIVSI